MLTVLLRATVDPFAGFVIETVGAMVSEPAVPVNQFDYRK